MSRCRDRAVKMSTKKPPQLRGLGLDFTSNREPSLFALEEPVASAWGFPAAVVVVAVVAEPLPACVFG